MEELRKKIAQDVNESKLPLDCIYYLLKDLFRDIEMQYSSYIQQMESQKQQEQENKITEKLTDNSKPNLQVLKNEEKGE